MRLLINSVNVHYLKITCSLQNSFCCQFHNSIYSLILSMYIKYRIYIVIHNFNKCLCVDEQSDFRTEKSNLVLKYHRSRNGILFVINHCG